MRVRAIRQPSRGPELWSRVAHQGAAVAVAALDGRLYTAGIDGRLCAFGGDGEPLGEVPAGPARWLVTTDDAVFVASVRVARAFTPDLGLLADIVLPAECRGVAGGREATLALGALGLWAWNPREGLRQLDPDPAEFVATHGNRVVVGAGTVVRELGTGASWTYDSSRLNPVEWAYLQRLAMFTDGTLLVAVRVDGDLHGFTECVRVDLGTGTTDVLSAAAAYVLAGPDGLLAPGDCEAGREGSRVNTGNVAVRAALPLDQTLFTVDGGGLLRAWRMGAATPPEDVGRFVDNAAAVPGELWTWDANRGEARRWSLADGRELGVVTGLPRGAVAAALRPDASLLVVEPTWADTLGERGMHSPVSLHDPSGQVVGRWRAGRDVKLLDGGRCIEWTEPRGWLRVIRPGEGTTEWRDARHAGGGFAVLAGDYVVTGCDGGGIAAWRRDTGAEVWRVHSPPVSALASTGTEVVALLHQRALCRYDLADGRVIGRATLPGPVVPGNLVANAEAVLLGASPAYYWPRGGEVREVEGTVGAWAVRAAADARHLIVLDFSQRPTGVGALTGHAFDTGLPASMALLDSMFGEGRVVASVDGDVALLENSRLVRLLSPGVAPFCLAARGDWVAGLFKDGKLRAWNLADDRAVELTGFTDDAWDLRFVGDARLAGWGRGDGEGWRQFDLVAGTVSEVAGLRPEAGPVGLGDLVTLDAVGVRVSIDVGGTTRRESRLPTRVAQPASALRVDGHAVRLEGPAGELVHYESPEGVRAACFHSPDRLAVIDERGGLTLLALDAPPAEAP